MTQPVGDGFIERYERLVKQQKIRAHRKCARDRCAARQAERQFSGIVREVRAEAEGFDQLGQIGGSGLSPWQRQPDILLDRAPGQKPRLLKHNAETPGSGRADSTAEIRIQPCRDLQDRGLAATRRADQRAERAGFEPKVEATNDLDRRAIGRPVALRIDAKFKRGGVASGLRVVQAVVPEGFRSQA